MVFWDRRVMKLAKHISTWSKDEERKVGCVIVTQRFRIVSAGYNGYPPGEDDEIKKDKLLKSVHAEINALLTLRTWGEPLRMYIYGGHPCAQCAAAILQENISHIFCPPIDESSKWAVHMNEAKKMLLNKIDLTYYTAIQV